MGFAEFFNTIEQSCYRVPENVERIKEDKWYREYMFYYSDILVLDTERIKEKYNNILYSARKLEILMLKEKDRLKHITL